jgi:hypothetical protein
MPKVRFVEGTIEDYSTIYDTEWPIVPRVGEFLSITVGTGQVMGWEVTRVVHVADGDEKLIGTLAWIERSETEPPQSQAMGFGYS